MPDNEERTFNVNLRFPRQPRPPRRHRFRDILWIGFACCLIGVPFGSYAGIVAAVLFGVILFAYLAAERKERES